MLSIVNFIKNNHNWREILSNEPYCLNIADDSGFTILKYSQISSDFNNKIVRECRGLILDNNYSPVCVPFYKFGNYGESYADIIDWDSAIIEEKIDGSLIKVWNYGGIWNVSTNGTIFAKNARLGSEDTININSPFSTFAHLFDAAIEKTGLNIEELNPQYTYMFELGSPYNRVVVPFHEIDLYHIGTRDNVSLNELEVDIGIKKPKIYKCNNLEDLIEMASKLKYNEEGYVVKDKYYHRIKVKSPAYVAVAHLINGMNDKRLLELVKRNETEEFLTYFPEYTEDINRLKDKVDKFVQYMKNFLNEHIYSQFETKKDFALTVTKSEYPAFFFNLYDGKLALNWLWSMPNDKALEQLNKLGD